MSDRQVRLAALASRAGRGMLSTSQDVEPEQDNDEQEKELPAQQQEIGLTRDTVTRRKEDAAAAVTVAPTNRKQPRIQFRNYTPTTHASSLLVSSQAKPQDDADDDDDTATTKNNIEHATPPPPPHKRPRSYHPTPRLLPASQAQTTTIGQSNKKSILELALEQARAEINLPMVGSTAAAPTTTITTTTLVAPRKVNWDLKRDLQPRLAKLEKRTQKAIVALLRERLERESCCCC